MKVTVEKLPKSSVSLDIAADEQEFKQAMDRAFRKINQLVNIPGFRPGKAPRRMVEQRIGREMIIDEAHREIMDDLYRRAIEQEEIVPVSEPSVDIYEREPLGFKVEIQVYPDVDLGDYSTVRAEPHEVNVEDSEVDEVIENLRTQNSTWVEPSEERTPVDGDQVILDLEVYDGEEQFHEPVEGADFVLGEGPLFDKIAEEVKKLKPGEKADFNIDFSADDEDAPEELHGKTLNYKVTLQEVKERDLPDLDELARNIGEHETGDDLRVAVRRDLLQNKVQQERDAFIDGVMEQFAEKASLEIPDGMVDSEIERDLENLRQRLSQENVSLEEYLRFGQKTLDDFKEELRPEVEKRVRNALILEAFAKVENLEVTDEDIKAEIERMVPDGEQAEQMREIYQSDYFRDMLVNQLQNRKLTEHIIEMVTEGKGAVTGEGAAVLEEMQQGPTAESAEVTGESPEADQAEESTAADSPEDDTSAEAEAAVAASESDDEDEKKH